MLKQNMFEGGLGGNSRIVPQTGVNFGHHNVAMRRDDSWEFLLELICFVGVDIKVELDNTTERKLGKCSTPFFWYRCV